MIVKCEQCQTRFKIPDEKVTDKGVKVRCTKCQHTFRVQRDGTTSATAQVAAHSAAPAPVPPPRPSDPDPFAKFGAGDPDGLGEVTRPGMYALGVEASKQGGPLQPSYAAQMDQPSGVFEQPTRVATIPSAPPGRKPLTDAARASAPSAPFDFSAAMGGPEPTQPGRFDFSAPPGAAPPAPFDFTAASASAPAFDFAAPAAPQPPAAYDFGPPAPTEQHPQYDPFAGSASTMNGEHTSPAAPTMEMGSAPAPSVFGADGGDFFASTDAPPPPQRTSASPSSPTQPQGQEYDGEEVQADTGMRGQLFDMPAAAPTQQIPAVGDDDDMPTEGKGVQLARLKLVSMPAGGAQPSDMPPPELPRRRLGGLVFNVAIASVLVLLMTVIGTVYLSEGKVELASFNWERLKSTFSSNSDWVAIDISNGLYDTRNGRPVFFVRGELKNRTSSATKAKVRAEILDGNTSIRHADVWVGTTPTPEELYAIATSEDVDHLLEKVGRSAIDVPPGEKRAFLVPFYEYPPDLKGFRLKVSVVQSGMGETAAR
jgi:predicted Zn finger-like uncharacterized protein